MTDLGPVFPPLQDRYHSGSAREGTFHRQRKKGRFRKGWDNHVRLPNLDLPPAPGATLGSFDSTGEGC